MFILCYIPTVVLFLVTARHRLPVIPFMLLFAAAGIIYLVELIRKKNYRRFNGLLALFLIILILCNRTYFDIGFSNVSQTHFNLALTYDRQGNLEMAETEYLTAVRENPNSATTLNNLGYVQYRLGKYDEAMNRFNRSVSIDPDFADPYNNIGMVYEAGEDFANAERFYLKALEIDPELFQAYLNLGDLFKAQNDLSRAESMYIKARDINPDNKAVFTKLAVLFAQKQDFARAEEMFTIAEKKGELSAIDLANWRNIYYATSQPVRALEYYRQSIEQDSEFVRGYFNTALVFYRFEYPADSTRKYLNEALRIDPSFEPARGLLNEINK
jgi:tetratricopeptide (TPR) repeat protein